MRFFNGRKLRQDTGPLGHVLGIVSDALKIGRDFQHRKHQPQVNGGGRAQSNQLGGIVVDLLFKQINGFVFGADLFCLLLIARCKCISRVEDRHFDKPTHFHNLGLDVLQIAVKRRSDVLIVHFSAP